MNSNFSQEIKKIIDNTKIIKETHSAITLYGYATMNFVVVGKAPYRDDISLAREGQIIISPQLLLTFNNPEYSVEELAAENDALIEARILFFNNHKLHFSEYPVKRYELNVEKTINEIMKNKSFFDNKHNVVIFTPDTKLWRVSLFSYLFKKLNDKRNKTDGFKNLLN